MPLKLARILTLFGLGVILFAPGTSSAQSFEKSAEGAVLSGSGSAALVQAGASFDHIAVAELLPSGQWLAEVVLTLDGKKIRWPLGLRRSPKDSSWEVSWQPDAEYGKALRNMLASGSLPKATGSGAWHEAQRLPAMPVIVTAKRYVTPFGAIDIKDDGGELRPSIPLLKHAQQWVSLALADDPAPAAIDLILDASLSWRVFNRAVFSISAAGLYQIFIITQSGNQWTWVGGSAPIAFQKASGPPPVVVGLYPRENAVGVRLSVRGELLAEENSCDPEMTFCAAEIEAFESGVGARISSAMQTDTKPLEHAMLAGPEALDVATAISRLEALRSTLGLGSHAIMLGFIQK